MPSMNISKSIVINAPADQVFRVIGNFNSWTKWSPWLIAEPDAKVDVSSDGEEYSWEGKVTGAGNMKITKSVEGESVEIDLHFIKPWKSQADVAFLLEKDGGGTKVTWTMKSGIPFFLFWMKKMMEVMVGMDYDRGLKMLKDFVEDGEVHSKLEFIGNEQFDGGKYIGIKTKCTMTEIGEQMQGDFIKINEYIEGKDFVIGHPFSIYHKWAFVKGNVEYTSGVLVSSVPDDLPNYFVIGEIPSTPVHTIRHTGPYEHLGNAWSTQMMYERGKVFKQNKKIHPFEVYVSDPAQTAPNDLVTEIHLPMK